MNRVFLNAEGIAPETQFGRQDDILFNRNSLETYVGPGIILDDRGELDLPTRTHELRDSCTIFSRVGGFEIAMMCRATIAA